MLGAATDEAGDDDEDDDGGALAVALATTTGRRAAMGLVPFVESLSGRRGSVQGTCFLTEMDESDRDKGRWGVGDNDGVLAVGCINAFADAGRRKDADVDVDVDVDVDDNEVAFPEGRPWSNLLLLAGRANNCCLSRNNLRALSCDEASNSDTHCSAKCGGTAFHAVTTQPSTVICLAVLGFNHPTARNASSTVSARPTVSTKVLHAACFCSADTSGDDAWMTDENMCVRGRGGERHQNKWIVTTDRRGRKKREGGGEGGGRRRRKEWTERKKDGKTGKKPRQGCMGGDVALGCVALRCVTLYGGGWMLLPKPYRWAKSGKSAKRQNSMPPWMGRPMMKGSSPRDNSSSAIC